MMRLQAGAVHRCQGHRRLELAEVFAQADRLVEEPADRLGAEQSLGRFLECGVIGDLLQLDGGCQIRHISQQRFHPAIIAMQEFFEDQTRKQLWLRVGLGTEFVRVVGQRQLPDEVAHQQNLARRFGRSSHTYRRYVSDPS